MPQHRSKKAGQLPFGKKKQQDSSSASAAEANQEPTWQRGQGAFSGKAKKEYLKWKRQQKEAAAASDSEGGGSNTTQAGSDVGGNNTTQAGSTGRITGSNQASSSQDTLCGQGAQQHLTAPDGSADDPTQPLQYRPLVAVPAAPFTTATAPEHAHDAVSSACAAAASADSSSDAVLRASATDVVYMPVLNPAEVGFTAEGFQLTMPARPAWQGIVNSAEELHELEEQQFQAWQKSLLATAAQSACNSNSSSAGAGPASTGQQQTARAGGVGRLSFYEGRLEFWRQLWRTLEMSDLVIMIVDARNPLLHFSHALYRHITQDHKLPLLLLLNKCDLIPAAAAAAWAVWLQQQLPGVTVLPVSAAAGEADAAAQQVVEAVLQQHVERGGQKVLVQDLVGKGVEELMAESLERNIHAKRHVMQQQQAPTAAATDGRSRTSTKPAAEAADNDADWHVKPAVALSAESDGSDSEWSLKPGRRAGARKGDKRGASRNHRHQQQQRQQLKKVPGGTASRAGLGPVAPAFGKHQRAAAAAPGDRLEGSCDETDSDYEREAESATTESESAAEPMSASESEPDEQLAAVNSMLEDLTIERQVSRTASFGRSGSAAESASAVDVGGSAAAAASASTSAAEADAGSVHAWQRDSRPVVIGLLGEPNVGKSSTLNALLGTHRVAVSCHPGRTKHYQTHFMSDRLVLCDCPGIVFPRLDVSLPMQVLFGSYPIASCRQPYAVLRYLASASSPRLQQKLGLKHPGQLGQTSSRSNHQQQQHQQHQQPASASNDVLPGSRDVTGSSDVTSGQVPVASDAAVTDGGDSADDADEAWSPWALCEALCEKRSWALPRSGRLDTYRAANWMLRAALGGKQGLGLAFMPPRCH